MDDHPLVREWLTHLIQQQPDLVVCGESEDAPHALQEISAMSRSIRQLANYLDQHPEALIRGKENPGGK